MKCPLLFNAASGTQTKDPDALLRTLPKDLRERLDPIPFGPPWDFDPAIAQASQAGTPLLIWGGDGTIHHAARALLEKG
ncbi:MAG TPA: diacylglycerol kinase family protein, partial [Geothrix sp.]|nr:diacylglycerol kinase family protein [Geothrix sp.]